MLYIISFDAELKALSFFLEGFCPPKNYEKREKFQHIHPCYKQKKFSFFIFKKLFGIVTVDISEPRIGQDLTKASPKRDHMLSM